MVTAPLREIVMPRPLISTPRRLQYAQGYLALGLMAEAAAELESITVEDRLSDEVLEITIDLHSMRQDWQHAVTAAEEYVRRHPDKPKGWISWAFALRRLKSIPDAELVLLEGEKRIGGTCALIHYNLACYRCQLGDRAGALQRLAIACRMEPHWKTAGLEDPDLASLRDDIAALVVGQGL
jgi:predicted Zn-dependent protease